jgi:DNA polymerase-3 subunit gamma/tau
LARVSIETLKKHFAWVAQQENIELTDGANDLLARAADGSVRDGLSLLDQAIAQTGGHVDEAATLDMLKRADRVVVVELMKTILSGDVAAALDKVDAIYNNGADLSMLLTDMMEWTHWATRMHPSLNAGAVTNSPYTADQREQIANINSRITVNTLSRIWQVMVAAVPEMQAASNQKQCFDMLIIRCMHIADIPSVPELLKQQESENRTRSVKNILADRMASAPSEPVKETLTITCVNDLGCALQSTKEILLYSYFSSNVEVSELSDGMIKYFDRKGDGDFAQKLSAWLSDKTGKTWVLTRLTESTNAQTISEQKQEELEADPLVASAMSLFENAEIVGVK